MSRADDREPLVPLQPGFDRVWGGFRKSQVRYYVDHAEAEIRIITEDRDAAMAQASALAGELESTMATVAELRAKVDELTTAPINTETLPHRLRRMVELAEQEAASVVKRAHASSAREWHLAERMAGDLRARYEQQLADADRWHAEWDNQRRLIVEQAKIEADALSESAAEQRKELDGQAEQRRQAVEADFTEAMAAKRAELAAELADERAVAERECERRLAEATAESTALVAAAHAEVARRLAEADHEATRRVTEARDDAARRVEAATAEINRLYTEGVADARRLVADATGEADRLRAAADDAAARRIGEADQHLATTRRNRRALADQVHAAREAIAAADLVLDDLGEALPGDQLATLADPAHPTGEFVPQPRREAVSEAPTVH